MADASYNGLGELPRGHVSDKGAPRPLFLPSHPPCPLPNGIRWTAVLFRRARGRISDPLQAPCWAGTACFAVRRLSGTPWRPPAF